MKTRLWGPKKVPAQQTAQVQSNLHRRAHSGFSDHFAVFLLVSPAGNRVWCSSSMPASSSKRRFIMRAWKLWSLSLYASLVPEVKGAVSEQGGLPGAEKGRTVAQFLSTWWKSFAIYQDCNGIGGTGRFTPASAHLGTATVAQTGSLPCRGLPIRPPAEYHSAKSRCIAMHRDQSALRACLEPYRWQCQDAPIPPLEQ